MSDFYTIQSNTAYINGNEGKYDNIVNNSEVRYARNSVDNYKHYVHDFKSDTVDLSGLKGKELDLAIEKLEKQKMPPIKFSQTYSKDGQINPLSLIGASFEEFEGRVSIPVKELTKKLQETFSKPNVIKQVFNNIKAVFNGEKTQKLDFKRTKLDASALDLNNDKKIDLAEYSTTILAADGLSDDKLDGVINNKGENKSLAFANKKNKKAAKQVFLNLYNTYNLQSAQAEFLKDKNNLYVG